MIEITVNDRLGGKARIKCNPSDTIGDVKKLAAAILGRSLFCTGVPPFLPHVHGGSWSFPMTPPSSRGCARESHFLLFALRFPPVASFSPSLPEDSSFSARAPVFARYVCLMCNLCAGKRPETMRFQKQHVILKDHISLDDYEIKDGMNIELYYNK